MFRKTFACVAACVVLSLTSVRFVGAQTPQQAAGQPTIEEIIADNMKAKGGLEKIQAVQSMKEVAQASTQGMSFEMTIYSKRPNLSRQEISIMGQMMVNAFDGTKAWMINPMMGADPTMVTGPQADIIKDQSDFDGPLVDYKAKGNVVEFVGTDAIGAVKAYHLKVTKKSGNVDHVYIDTTTSLEIKVVSESSSGGATAKAEIEIGDYRAVEGLMMPYSIKTYQNGSLAVALTLSTIELNPKIDDALFHMPVK
jgi:outer membrane lipoprotein-sorting protein